MTRATEVKFEIIWSIELDRGVHSLNLIPQLWLDWHPMAIVIAGLLMCGVN